jgi:hypothetical protein
MVVARTHPTEFEKTADLVENFTDPAPCKSGMRVVIRAAVGAPEFRSLWHNGRVAAAALRQAQAQVLQAEAEVMPAEPSNAFGTRRSPPARLRVIGGMTMRLVVANGIVLTISGWLSAVIGRKRYFLICLSMFTVCSLLCGIADSLSQLIVFRLLQGFFGGGLQPGQQSIIFDTFPLAKLTWAGGDHPSAQDRRRFSRAGRRGRAGGHEWPPQPIQTCGNECRHRRSRYILRHAGAGKSFSPDHARVVARTGTCVTRICSLRSARS